MSKLRIAPKGWKQLFPSLKFQKLVELTCKQLTVPVYNFVMLVQKVQLSGSFEKFFIALSLGKGSSPFHLKWRGAN
jgi:Fanconi anemia group I protein